jgi:hypothetical protein
MFPAGFTAMITTFQKERLVLELLTSRTPLLAQRRLGILTSGSISMSWISLHGESFQQSFPIFHIPQLWSRLGLG